MQTALFELVPVLGLLSRTGRVELVDRERRLEDRRVAAKGGNRWEAFPGGQGVELVVVHELVGVDG